MAVVHFKYMYNIYSKNMQHKTDVKPHTYLCDTYIRDRCIICILNI